MMIDNLVFAKMLSPDIELPCFPSSNMDLLRARLGARRQGQGQDMGSDYWGGDQRSQLVSIG